MATSLPHNGLNAVSESSQEVSDYQRVLHQLIERIERSTTHYEAMGLDHTATYEQIVRAYNQAFLLFYPNYQLRVSIPDEILERMDRAFGKISWAFATLADFKKRADYHSLVLSKLKNAAPMKTTKSTSRQSIKHDSNATLQALQEARRFTTSHPAYTGTLTAVEGELALNVQKSRANRVYSEFLTEKKDDNRRRSQRFRLALPALITGYDRSGSKWNEMTQSQDVSRTGITVQTRRRLRNGLIVYLSIPLPVKMRSHGFSDATYCTYALVRRVEPSGKGERVVALEFIGEHPPAGYFEKPWATFKPSQWTGHERRRDKRHNRTEKVQIEYFNDALESLGKEQTVSENISRQGMRLRVARAPYEFELVRVTCLALKFQSLAVVRSRYVNKDNIERLCVQFINVSQRNEEV